MAYRNRDYRIPGKEYSCGVGLTRRGRWSDYKFNKGSVVVIREMDGGGIRRLAESFRSQRVKADSDSTVFDL